MNTTMKALSAVTLSLLFLGLIACAATDSRAQTTSAPAASSRASQPARTMPASTQKASASAPSPSCSAYKIHLAYYGVSVASDTQRYITKLDAIVGGLSEDQKAAIAKAIGAANEEITTWRKENAGKEDQAPQMVFTDFPMPEPVAKACVKRDAAIAAVLTEKQHLAFGRSQMLGHLRTNFVYSHSLTAEQMEMITAKVDNAIVDLRRDGKLPVQYLRMVGPLMQMIGEVRQQYGGASASAPVTGTQASAPASRPGQLVDIWINYDSPFIHGSLYSARLSQGDSVTLTLLGRDDGWKWFWLPANAKIEWKSSPEVEITAKSNSIVVAKIVKPITSQAYVYAQTASCDGKELRAYFYIAPKK